MLESLKKTSNMTYTENGAAAYRSTNAACLDLFASCGALRGAAEDRIFTLFRRAYAENPDTAMRILFYARDIRGGLGERKFFNIIMHRLADSHPASVLRNLPFFAEYGRCDDMLSLLGTRCEKEMAAWIRQQLAKDLAAMEAGRSISLLAKWLPSVNTSSAYTREQAKTLCRLLGMREKEYRKTLSALRAHIDIVETHLCRREYSFDYAALPGKAMFQYRHAFWENDRERYEQYMENVRCGREKMHTGTLYPYDIVNAVLEYSEPAIAAAMDTTWKALPDYTDGRNALAVIDGSGSMYWERGACATPAAVAMSLGIYFAQRNTGRFANHFITFSETPQLVEIRGSTIAEQVEYCMSYNEVANTDLYEVFMLILLTAVKNNLPQSELPELLYIISDMEFDQGVSCDKTVFEDAKEKFEEYGYQLPQIVYWNVASRHNQFPVDRDEKGVALISGASPSLFTRMMSCDLTPQSMMDMILSAPRYQVICA